MINAGFNPLQQMAEKTGKSITQLKEEMSKGAISAEMVQQAFIDATSAGGKFYKMSENASKTINGQLSMMQDAIDAAFNEIGQASEGVIIKGIQGTTSLIENYEQMGRIIAGLVGVYGTYRTAVMITTAAQGLQAAGISSLTAKEIIHLGWINATTAAQKVLNATMLSNPYVLVATAIAGVIAVLVSMKTETERVNAVMEEYNAERDVAIQKETEHKQKVEELINIASEESASLENRKLALVKLEQQYPAIFAKYKTEYEMLKDIRNIRAEINALEEKKSIAGTQNEINDLDARIEAIKKKKETASKKYGSLGEAYRIGAITQKDEDQLKGYEKLRASLKTKASKENAEDYFKNLTGVSNKELRRQIKQREDLLTKMQLTGHRKGYINYGGATGTFTKDELEAQKNRLKRELNQRNTPKKSSSDWAKSRKADYDKALKEYNDFVNDKSNKVDEEKYQKEAQKLKDALNTAKKAYDATKPNTKSGGNKSNVKNENKNRLEAEKKANEELLKLQQENRQAQLDLEEDTTEKKLQLIDLSYDKQKAEIAKKERELAEQNKKAGTTGLNEKGLTAEQQEEIDKANKINEKSREKQIADTYKAEMSAMRDYLKEYGSFQQQKLAIAEEYAEKIEKAQNEGERLTLEKQRESALQKVEIDALRQEIDWKGLLGDFGGLFEEQLKPTLEKLRKYTESNEFKQADIQDQQVIYDLITKLTQETSDGWSGMFKNLGDATNNYREKVIALEKATEEAKKADEEYAIAKTKAGDNAATDENVKALGEAARNAAENQKAAQSDVIQAQNEMSDAATRVRSNLNNLANGLQQLGSGSMSGILQGANSIAEIFKVNDLSGEIGKKLADGATKVFGKAAGEALAGPMGGEIVEGVFSLLDLFKGGIENLFSSLIDTILGAVNGLLDTMLNGKIITSVASSLKDGIGNILNTITFGGFSSWITGSNAKEVAETIDRLTNRNELLTVAIEELTDEMANARGAKAIDISRRAVNLQEETNKNYALMAQAQAGYHGSHHSWNYYWGGYSQEQINRLSQQMGREWNGDIWSLSPEEMKMLQGNVDMWEQILTTGKGGYGYSVGEKLQAYIDQAGKLEDITNQLYETLTTTTADNVFDDFLNSLYALADGSDAVFDNIADSWQQMVNKMAVNNIVGASFQEKLNDWYQRLAKLNESRTEGKITDEEYKAKLDILQKEYEDYVKKAQNDIESLRDVGVIQAVDSEADAQKATSRGFGSEMTHEDAGELSGRFTAMYESNIRIEAATQQQALAITELSGNMSNMIGQMQNMYNIADETRTILVNSFLELQQISENTGAIVKPIKQIQTDIAEVKRNTSRL